MSLEAAEPSDERSDAASEVRVDVASTDDLDPDVLTAIRALLDRAVEGGFTDDDWHHSLGGRHVLVHRNGTLAAHVAVVRREIWIGGAEVEARYVEAVATEPADQGRGLGAVAMGAAGDLIAQDGALGVLSTGATRFCARLGWRSWRGPTWVIGPDGTRTRTPAEDDGIMVLGRVDDLSASIACRARPGDDW